MAWNNPTNTSVLQVWTSAKVNETYDNIRYLKGQAGTVQIENNVNFGAATPGASTRLGVGANGSGARTSYIDLAGDDTWGDGLRLIRDAAGTSRIVHRGTADFQLQTIEAAAMWFRTNSALRGGWSAAGNWAVGNTDPQGRIHATGPNGGGCIFWDYNGFGGSDVQILPSGTVTNALTGIGILKPVSTAVGSFVLNGSSTLSPGVGATVYTLGSPTVTDSVVITCTASGGVTIRRGAGSQTYKVSVWLTWI